MLFRSKMKESGAKIRRLDGFIIDAVQKQYRPELAKGSAPVKSKSRNKKKNNNVNRNEPGKRDIVYRPKAWDEEEKRRNSDGYEKIRRILGE